MLTQYSDSQTDVTGAVIGAVTGGVVAVAFIIIIAVVAVVLLRNYYCRGHYSIGHGPQKKYVISLYVVSTVKCEGDFSPCMVVNMIGN